jgi:glycosyltransferase involved in cell wall biosynthesis
MEAMSAGTVPVCTAVGGVPELIEHGQNGFLTPPGDESGMAGALEKLIGSLSTRRDMSDKASRKARQNFDILEMTKKYEDLFLNYDTSNCR